MAISIPIAPGKPSRARREVRAALTDFPAEVVETAELLTSELVTNALVHGQGEAILILDVDERHVRVEVVDADPTTELTPLQVEVTSTHGRGLAIVDALASDWGVAPRGAGKAVWFELHF